MRSTPSIQGEIQYLDPGLTQVAFITRSINKVIGIKQLSFGIRRNVKFNSYKSMDNECKLSHIRKVALMFAKMPK